MIILTKIRRQRILEELKYYSQYDDIYTKEQWLSFFDMLQETNRLELTIESFGSFEFAKFILQYIYSHIDVDGSNCRLEDLVLKDEYIKKHYQYFKDLNSQFVHYLIYKNKPLYFIDVDNTLTDYGVLSKEKIDYIRNLPNKDNIILSTGKVSKSIENVINELGLEHNYYSCLNGSVICKDGKYDLINKLGNVSKGIIEEFKKLDCVFIAYYEDCIKLIVNLDEYSKAMLTKYNELFLDESGKEVDYDRIVKLLLFIKDDGSEEQKSLEDKVNKIIKKYPDLVTVRTAYQCYEVLRKDQHKGQSVVRISELMNKYYRASIGVGDSMNDYPMIQNTGKGFIVSTASEELKSKKIRILENNRDVDIVNLIRHYEESEY